MPLFTFIADDLTGAADVIAQAHRFGLSAAFVIGDSTLPLNLDVVGIAGPARSLSGDALAQRVRHDIEKIREVPSKALLYKICSTFDSSPTTGSIGKGLELLREAFPEHGPVAIAPAQPQFGRYTAFSNHFASAADAVYRLDRHPVMSKHPSTPMSNADLREVLAEQLSDQSTLGEIHLPAYEDDSFFTRWDQQRQHSSQAGFIVDAVSDEHLSTLAEALLSQDNLEGPPVVIGSGGMMTALARTQQQPQDTQEASLPTAATGPSLVVSASASRVTQEQITHALDHGWQEIAVPEALLQSHASETEAVNLLHDEAAEALRTGHNVIVHTTRGTEDPRYRSTTRVDPAHVGALLGRLVRELVQTGLTQDVAVFGGDTSSHALEAMGVHELRVTEQFVTAGPICQAESRSGMDHCRLLLKGGQVGPPDILQKFIGAHPGLSDTTITGH